MKKLLGLIILCSMFTGCAQMQENMRRNMLSPVDVAKEDCIKIGYKSNTADFRNCVLVTSQNIRNARAQAAAADAMAPRNYGPKTTTCNRVGSSVQCTEF